MRKLRRNVLKNKLGTNKIKNQWRELQIENMVINNGG